MTPPPLLLGDSRMAIPGLDIITRRTEAYINFRGTVSSRTRQYETLRSNMAWGGDEAWRHIRPVHRSSWILSRPPADRKLWDSDFDPDVPIRVYMLYIYIYIPFTSFRLDERSWNAADFPSPPLSPLARSLGPSPSRQVDAGKCCVSSNFVTRNRIMRPCIAINQRQGKKRFGDWGQGRTRVTCNFCLQCLPSTVACIAYFQGNIVLYCYKKENRLIERLTRRVQSDFMRNILLILF